MIQKEIDEGRLIFSNQEKKDMEIDTNPFPSQVNMVDPKGKKPMHGPESVGCVSQGSK